MARIPPHTHSPLLSDEADVKFTSLQVLPGVAHDLVKRIFQQVVSAHDQSEMGHKIGVSIRTCADVREHC